MPSTGDAEKVAESELFRRFVEELFSAPGTGGTQASGQADDWLTIWSSADGADSREQAIGRVVMAAHRFAATGTHGPARNGARGVLDRAAVTGLAPVGPGRAATALVERPAPPVPVPPPARALQPVLAPEPARPPQPAPHPVSVETLLHEEFTPITATPSPPRGAARLRRRQQLANAFGWVRNIGIVVILFAAWQVWGTSIAQHQAQQSLGAQFRSHTKTGHASTGVQLVSAAVTVPAPAQGAVVARLQIPAIGVDQYVVEGTAEGDLAKG
ncbi:MAG: hypothetical protein ABSG81_13685, partial [Acidimicrobiales bacterium]